tara:strand:- start:18680 stop:19564 length:885 start_codon:yes stop_codon:yes gene_type:complete
MKVFFIGSVRFSEKILKTLIDLNAEIVGISSIKNSKLNSDFTNLGNIALKNKIPINFDDNINSKKSLKFIRSKNPDVIFCMGLSKLIKRELLEIPKVGVVGYHPSLLPRNRGRHPLIWALVLGLRQTGSTFFFMDEGADSGPIISQEKVQIKKSDTANSLYKKIEITASKQLKKFFPILKNNKLKPLKQNNKSASYWRKRSNKDGMINWNMSSEVIYNLVRALSKPYPGATFIYKDRLIKLWKCKIISYKNCNIEPGKVLNTKNNQILVKTSNGAISLLEIEPKINFSVGEYFL